MVPHGGYTATGRPCVASAMVRLDGDCKAALDEWYMRVCTHGLMKQFKCCRGTSSVTRLGMWMDRKCGRGLAKGGVKKVGGSRMVRLVTPWRTYEGCPASMVSLAGRRVMAQVMATSIKLLREFLGDYVERCGDVVEIRTNIGEFATYIAKDCFPRGLDRQCFRESVAIHRRLQGTDGERGQT